MSRRKRAGVRLPFALEKELGLELRWNRGQRNEFTARGGKEQRRGGRVEKPNISRAAREHARAKRAVEEEDEDGSSDLEVRSHRVQTTTSKPKAAPPPTTVQPKPILKKPRLSPPSPSLDDDSVSSRASSPGLVLDANSKSFQTRAAEDDDEIAALEKKLGLKNRRIGKVLDEDGLGDLMGGIESDDEDNKRKREQVEWLQRKRRRRQEPDPGPQTDVTVEQDVDASSPGLDTQGKDTLDSAGSADEEEHSFSGFDSDTSEEAPPRQATKVRENPYVAPVASSATSTKYVPPSLRRSQNGDIQMLGRLRRQIQGHLNRLSDANLISILKEIENVYDSNPRQDVTSTLIDLALARFCDPATLQATFVLLHAAFCSAIYKVIGTDFGAELLARLVERFSQYHNDTSNTSKEALNLVSLLSHLYTFHVTSSTLVYSHINLLLSPLSESTTELLLRIIRDCGPQLRSDDPSALKSVVSQTQLAAQALPSPVSVRTQFMLEIIINLKNNKLRESTKDSHFTREHITKLRKTLGSLNSRSLRATEPLRLTLDDLRNSDRKGKWWLVGASWKGESSTPDSQPASLTEGASHVHGSSELADTHDTFADYHALARHLGFSTPLQISIVTAIATSTDATDAIARLSKLRLKRAQESEVSRVLLRCCGKEKGFNTYYYDLAKRLCSAENGKQWTKRLEFSFWGFMRRLADGVGGSDDEGQESGGDVEMSEVFNIAKLYAQLIHSSTMSLSVLRPLDLLTLGEKGRMFIELLFVNIFALCKGQENDTSRIFSRLGEAKSVIGPVRVFLKKVVKGSDLLGKKNGEKDMLRRAVRVAVRELEKLEMRQTENEVN